MQNENTNKKSLNFSPDAFYGRPKEYNFTTQYYDHCKIAYGPWDFKIKFNDDEEPTVSFAGVYRNGFVHLLNHYGFFKQFRTDGSCFLLRCIDNVIEEVDTIHISDFILEYLDKKGLNFSIENEINGVTVTLSATLELQHETFKKQCNSLFSRKFFELLPTFDREIVTDNENECYKLFKNKVCKITAVGIELIDYCDLQKCVWKKHVKQFDFEFTKDFKESHFYKFICNVSNAKEESQRFSAFINAIGYLLHKYNAPENGQCVICYDESITDIDKPQGGTGKGVFVNALSHLSEMVKIDGKKFDGNDRFCFQRITDSTQLVSFDDVKSKLGFDRFNSLLTEGWSIEKKNKDEYYILPINSPKTVLTSNSIIECEGSTRKRRQLILEFSNYYSQHINKGNEQPIKDIHKCVFFSKDWDHHEWQMFYSFLISCIIDYMQKGLIHYEPKNVMTNRLRQTTTADFAEWIICENIEMNKTYEVKPMYESFRNCYYEEGDKFSQRLFSSYLKKYATLIGCTFKQPKPTGGKTFFQFLG
jgi:hypothetical protein